MGCGRGGVLISDVQTVTLSHSFSHSLPFSLPACSLIHTHSCTFTCIHLCTYIYTQTCLDTYAHNMHAHAHTHAQTSTHFYFWHPPIPLPPTPTPNTNIVYFKSMMVVTERRRLKTCLYSHCAVARSTSATWRHCSWPTTT